MEGSRRAVPLGEQLGGVERDGHDAGALGGGVRPGGAHDLLHLGQDTPQVVVVLGNHSQVAHSLV